METGVARRQAQILRTIAHPTRLLVLEELAHGMKCVSDIRGLLDIPQPNTSQHLAALKDIGLVTCHKDGVVRCYHLARPGLVRDLIALLGREYPVAEVGSPERCHAARIAQRRARDAEPNRATARTQQRMGTHGIEPFERATDRYDAWFDSDRGKPLFESEVLCLRRLAAGLERPWLEVGVGTGRFAEALEIDIGVDPTHAALEYAARRGIRVLGARGEALPFGTGEFGTVFVIVTICFAEDPEGLLREAARVAGQKGAVVLGIVPADSPWGRVYVTEGKAGHTFYSQARLFTLEDLEDLARSAGLEFERCVSTLFQRPGDGPVAVESPRDGRFDEAGFVAVLCRARTPLVPAPDAQVADPERTPDVSGRLR